MTNDELLEPGNGNEPGILQQASALRPYADKWAEPIRKTTSYGAPQSSGRDLHASWRAAANGQFELLAVAARRWCLRVGRWEQAKGPLTSVLPSQGAIQLKLPRLDSNQEPTD